MALAEAEIEPNLAEGLKPAFTRGDAAEATRSDLLRGPTDACQLQQKIAARERLKRRKTTAAESRPRDASRAESRPRDASRTQVPLGHA